MKKYRDSISAAAAAMGRAKSDRKTAAARENGRLGGRPIMKRYPIIIATIRDGNVQKISRHEVTTAGSASRLLKNNCQIWMTRDTATALGGEVETCWGRFPDGTEFQVKSESVMAGT